MNTQAQTQTHQAALVNVNYTVQVFHRLTQLPDKVLQRAFTAYNCGISRHQDFAAGVYTIVDFQLPDYQRRLWVLDVEHNKVLYHTYLAHGVGSGGDVPTHFSNAPNSSTSSIGLFRTGHSYYGEWGYAMRLYGLEKNFDSNAYSRDIVFHSSPNVGVATISRYGRIGRSHGCFVVPQKLVHAIVDKVRDGSLLFAYYPQPAWLKSSSYLHCPV